MCLIFARVHDRRSAKQREQPSTTGEQRLTINAVFDVISVFKHFYDVEMCRRCQPAFGMISRHHLKRIRLTSGNNVNPAFIGSQSGPRPIFITCGSSFKVLGPSNLKHLRHPWRKVVRIKILPPGYVPKGPSPKGPLHSMKSRGSYNP